MSDDRANIASFPTLLGYEIRAELRRDRLGVVYRAYQVLHRREVALRLVDEQAGGGRDSTAICRAAWDAGQVSHPHLLALFDAGENEGLFYLTSELPPGPSLRERLAVGTLPPEEAARIIATVARAVQHLHEHHVMHLGLTSACIFLGDGGPRVGDIGLAGLLQAHPGVPFPGEPEYAAPEQLAGARAGQRADVFALGRLLHECLTGQPAPAAGGWLGPRVSVPGCPALEQVCGKALADRPERRHTSAAELADELERFQRGEAPPPGALARLASWTSRRAGAVVAAAALVLVVLGAILARSAVVSRIDAARAEADHWQRQAENAEADLRAARSDHEAATRRATDQVRAAEDRAATVGLERDRERKRAFDEERLRLQAERRYKEQSEQRISAEEKAREAVEAHKAALTARTEAARQLDRLHVAHGTALLDASDLSGALVPFVRALAVARREKLPEHAHRLRIAAVLARCPRPISLNGQSKGAVTAVRLSTDGERVLSVGADGVVTVHAVASGRVVGKPLVHGAAVPQAVFSPDGKRVLSADADGQLRLWNVEAATEVFDPINLGAVALHLGFSGDGKRFVTVQPSPTRKALQRRSAMRPAARRSAPRSRLRWRRAARPSRPMANVCCCAAPTGQRGCTMWRRASRSGQRSATTGRSSRRCSAPTAGSC